MGRFPEGVLLYSASSFKDIKTCPARLHFKKLARQKIITEDINYPTVYGSAAHHAIELRLKGSETDPMRIAMEFVQENLFDKFDASLFDQKKVKDRNELLERCVKNFEDNFYRSMMETITDPEGQIELGLEMPWRKGFLVGKLDVALPEIWADWKTGGTEPKIEDLMGDIQNLLYYYMGKKIGVPSPKVFEYVYLYGFNQARKEEVLKSGINKGKTRKVIDDDNPRWKYSYGVFPSDERANQLLTNEIIPLAKLMEENIVYKNKSSYNCFGAGTKVLTPSGMVNIETLTGKNIQVLNHNSEWEDATVEDFGKQETVEVKFRRHLVTQTLRVTKDHLWLTQQGDLKTTVDLTVKDRLPFTISPKSVDINSIDYKLGLKHGLVYGDGTTTTSCKRTLGYMIRLCSDANDLLPYFEGHSVCYPPSANGDPVVTMTDAFAKTHSLKTLPSENETPDYLTGFFRGWLAADGTVSLSAVSLCCGEQEIEWLRKVMPAHGFLFGNAQKLATFTNYGERKKSLWALTVKAESLSPEDFLISRKRERFLSFKPTRGNMWGIAEIVEGSERIETVYCAVVPDSHTFTLDQGLVTHNCNGCKYKTACWQTDLPVVSEQEHLYLIEEKKEAPSGE